MNSVPHDWMSRWDLYSPHKIAVKEYESGRTLTYRQINNAGGNLAEYLTGTLGLKQGDRVAVLADHCLEYIALLSTAQKAGLVIVPLNYRLSPVELDFIIRDASPAILFVEEKYKANVLDKTPVQVLPLNNISKNWHPDQKSAFDTVEIAEDDPIFLLYTSGTTGFPKGVRYSHKMLFWNSINTSMALIINTETISVNMMPPFHTGGWNVLVTPVLHHGGYQILAKKFDAFHLNQILMDEGVTIFMGVPTMLQMMALQDNFKAENFKTVLYIIVGGEPMPIPLIEQYSELNVAVRQGYGLTEVGPNITSLHHDDAMTKRGSIGRHNFFVNIKVVKEDGSDAAPNEAGELWLQGPMMMKSYWNNPDMTRATLSEDGQWFKTGDIVVVDEDQYIYVVDRLKNMFISGGENIYPAEIEKVLRRHESIAECVVIGIKDAQWGEVGKAFVVFKEGAKPLSETELKTYCGMNLARFKIPKYFIQMDEIPKNDAGKLNRKALKNY